MSKSSWESLTKQEATLLIQLYDTEAYKALKKLLEAERLNIAKLCAELSGMDPGQIVMNLKYLQGQAYALKQIHKIVKEQYQLDKKKELAAERKEAARGNIARVRAKRRTKVAS